MDADGVRPELLADAFRATRRRVLVTQPLFQNPTGATLAPVRRPEILAIARAAGAFVVEDDFARRLVHDDSGPLPAPLAAGDPDGTVVHVCSLTKVTSPSLRVGALAAVARCWSACGPSGRRQLLRTRPLQEAALELVGSRPGAAAWPPSPPSCATAVRPWPPPSAASSRNSRCRTVPAGGGSLWLRLPGGGADRSRPSSRPPCAPRSPSPPAAPTSAPNPRPDTSA